MNTELTFQHRGFDARMKSMMKADFRRMFTSGLFYIMMGIALVMPVLILVMTTMMDGSVSVDPNTGAETVIEGFKNAWQIIGTVSDGSTISGGGSGMADGNAHADMSMTSMCNMNLMYFAIVVLACLFIAEDFRSGYAKNLFTVRAKRNEYIYSKLILLFLCGALMMAAFFIGSLVGGVVAGLPFTMSGFGAWNLVMCMIAKIGLVAVFVPIFILAAVFAKQKTWLGLVISCFAGMLLFMMVPMMTPLNAGVLHAGMCIAGGALFSAGLGAVSTALLKKRDLVF